MKKTFNLRKYIKKAFYEDVRGYWNCQGRAWKNCYKQKSDKGMQPQEAFESCLAEYQKSSKTADWILNYSSDKNDEHPPRFDAKTPAAKKITK